jgi:glycosyltransferase involved in cell wall biosynthesis
MKAYEAMACGAPVVSTAVGIEGLGLRASVHYLEADSGHDFAEAILLLISNPILGRETSRRARSFVDEHGSHLAGAKRFEEICLRAAGLLPRIAAEVGGGAARPVSQLMSAASK